jgi:cytochrome o ubiquinol oxidase subunit 2
MNKKYKFIILAIFFIAAFSLAGYYLHHQNIAILNPKGPVAHQERNLIYIALALALLVVIPVYTMTIVFAVRYREGNKKAKYSPEMSGNRIVETIWWVIPSLIILVLATIAWRSAHTLDPWKPLVSSTKPLNVEVVAMNWKWLFIYPQQNIASVNYVLFPVNTPINFQITSDTVMNSFWIPQLGGQIYAMPGMDTQIHLLASSYGTFNGSSANISGQGFAGMTFSAISTSDNGFNSWVKTVKKNSGDLNAAEYTALSKPSENNPPVFYASAANNLFYNIIDKYMIPSGSYGAATNIPGATTQ